MKLSNLIFAKFDSHAYKKSTDTTKVNTKTIKDRSLSAPITTCQLREFKQNSSKRNMTYDNVIILGAGASVNARIPLLYDFVDRMWNYAVRGKSHDRTISPEDVALLQKANQIRLELERYNTRANFNTRNLEDVLSLLSFEAMAGAEAQERYDIWVKAITRTIELSTIHEDHGMSNLRRKDSYYHRLWHSILGTDLYQRPPALITFNYDLTLERTLSEYFHYITTDNFKPAIASCKICYFLEPCDFILKSKQTHYEISDTNNTPGRIIRFQGIEPELRLNRDEDADVEVPYLKLHGSLNWCRRAVAMENKAKNLSPPNLPTQVAETPLILPPVFNKMNSGNVNLIWQKALEILRQAKHIIIVGYSLPKTDIYMQYFLKAAVGPNSDLQWIFVFDPALYRNDSSAKEMKSRYRDCFSPQFSERIIFEPNTVEHLDEREKGTFVHFVESLRSDTKHLLF